MGYNSTIRICTTKEGFEKVKAYVYEKTKGTNSRNLLDCLDEQIVGEDRDFVIFGWNSISWDEYYFDDVIAVAEALNFIEDLEIPFTFIRVGKSYKGDVDTQNNDPYNTLPSMSVNTIINYEESIQGPENHFALYSCDEWKSCSSTKLIGVFTRIGLLSQLSKKIEAGAMDFGRSESLDELSIRDIDSSLKYGFVQELSINEVL